MARTPTPPPIGIDYTKLLNAEQCDVVLHAQGPSLVLAGAGSGKTRTLIFKLVRLLEEGVPAEQILLLTFTNKAAREMAERAEGILGSVPKGLWAGTFHAIANRILRKHGSLIGYPSSFTILDQGDSESLVTQAAREYLESNKSLPKPAAVQHVLSFARNNRSDIEDTLATQFPYWLKYQKYFDHVATQYQELKQRARVMDFDDLLENWLKLLMEHPDVCSALSQQFRYILVDEYQDTNILQAEIIRLIGADAKLLLAVGDDAQSIYSFRAANIENILDFPNRFPGAKVYKLEQNYRSQPNILEVANAVIKGNQRQFEKELKSDRVPSAKPYLVSLRDKEHQAEYVAESIAHSVRSGRDGNSPFSYRDIAILVRSSFETLELEVALAKRGIPYLKRGGIRYFEQAHIKDSLSFLKARAHHTDYLAWMRILTMLTGIGAKTADRIAHDIMAREEFSPAVFGELKKYIPPKAEAHFAALASVFEQMHMAERPAEMLSIVVEGLYREYASTVFVDFEDRLDAISSLGVYASKYATLDGFLADIALSENYTSSAEDAASRVVVSTIHQAKGLEWGIVFVPGLVEGRFPHAKSVDEDAALEEERRLFYVAVTRAKDALYLLFPVTAFAPRIGTVFNKPSRFVQEIPAHLVEKILQTDAHVSEAVIDLADDSAGVLGRVMAVERAKHKKY